MKFCTRYAHCHYLSFSTLPLWQAYPCVNFSASKAVPPIRQSFWSFFFFCVVIYLPLTTSSGLHQTVPSSTLFYLHPASVVITNTSFSLHAVLLLLFSLFIQTTSFFFLLQPRTENASVKPASKKQDNPDTN
ncbi:hypothetical protein, unlikely [Trypanosoma brucei gambiense DAL972]|uniref:Uncharacterized protein n=1 Tax=Trypanosoma brucei gambiense (strain MHOM/CI/86/DAL972) TaxID=679716 RepID=D0A2E0_TRYB9|nr:hypothetical protein, unlikely [Trypanosoma brucei gambiense DAL972]CBH15434.1 hypothetical protein, unlikely [Trypanosoma brucei gambiense DAL972]|eukprot:XP_011777698.1 hypothetical protein, unlikely [Trypanosoma brucei gambiense DAL972]